MTSIMKRLKHSVIFFSLTLLSTLVFAKSHHRAVHSSAHNAKPSIAKHALVDLNTADPHTLARVMKGIGRHRAKLIVAYREKHGRFQQLNDLSLVHGISKKTVQRYQTSWQGVLTLAHPVSAEPNA